MLQDHTWRLKYTAEDGDLVRRFYVPALEDAKRYDRLTGYFKAEALAIAARGIEGLVRNDGRMRLVVGCTLDQPEIDAIKRGEQLRVLVDRHLATLPLAPPDPAAEEALELLAWMVAGGFLQVKVAVPCDGQRNPIPEHGIFHEKTGIIEDRVGDRLAWSGSLNETTSGWQTNWESISVFASWGPEPGRVEAEEESFARLWAGKAKRVVVLDIPEALRRDLMRFMPTTDLPARLKSVTSEEVVSQPVKLPEASLRDRVWSFIRQAPSRPGGEMVGAATAAVEPWPHQARAFERLYGNWPPRLLIADEVGLGKTVQAGMVLRQAWLAGRAKRILILAPKAVLGQWQIELREKFNLNWPIYDGGKFTWYPSPALRGRNERDAGRDDWHREPAMIASSQLMRRSDRAMEILEQAKPWDLVVLDEAHHARRRSAGSGREGGANTLLKLMRGLKERTQGLILLTATPMQVHPIEVWDLLDLLGLPPEWTQEAFIDFFDLVEHPNPSREAMETLASLFRAAERIFGATQWSEVERLTGLSRLKAKRVLRALCDDSSIPRRQLESAERRAAVKVMRAGTPIRRLVSRNTRELLRGYFRQGLLSTPIAARQVEDRFLQMSKAEWGIYEAVEDYIASAYGRAGKQERSAVGFVMTIYRRRLASSFVALRTTLKRRRDAIDAVKQAELTVFEEDLPDDDLSEQATDQDEAEKLEREALAIEQRAEIDWLLGKIGGLPPDSKLGALKQVLQELREGPYQQAMVFTQYTATMDFLRERLLEDGEWKLLCFSGRGGEIPTSDHTWRVIGREDAKRRFRDKEADILLCTDAAAEGLNFQFCGALVNYDMPWNPMRVEQRIGRIDRLGQAHRTIRIVNLHYEGTVETDIYQALRERIGLFESVVGRLQPILAQMPGKISQSVLERKNRARVVDAIEHEAREQKRSGFDIDEVTEGDLTMPALPRSTVTMEDLDRIIGSSDLMPPGAEIQAMGHREYGLLAPGMSAAVRVTTDPEYFDEHPESAELWSPGNALFFAPEFSHDVEIEPEVGTLKDLLDGA